MVAKIIVMAGGAAVVALGAGVALLAFGGDASAGKKLVGDDYGAVRREALDMFPRGQPIAEVRKGLTALGFRCAPTHRLVPNVNAPSIECDSAGRGYPTSSRMEVTVMSRNGALSDIAIGNGLDPVVADARTPNPNPGAGRTPDAAP